MLEFKSYTFPVVLIQYSSALHCPSGGWTWVIRVLRLVYQFFYYFLIVVMGGQTRLSWLTPKEIYRRTNYNSMKQTIILRTSYRIYLFAQQNYRKYTELIDNIRLHVVLLCELLVLRRIHRDKTSRNYKNESPLSFTPIVSIDACNGSETHYLALWQASHCVTSYIEIYHSEGL